MWIYQTADNWSKDIFQIKEEKGIFTLSRFNAEGVKTLLLTSPAKCYKEIFSKNYPAVVGRTWICWEEGFEWCMQILESSIV